MHKDIDGLILEWQAWTKENELPNMSADELLFEKGDEMTEEQRKYVAAFIDRWTYVVGP